MGFGFVGTGMHLISCQLTCKGQGYSQHNMCDQRWKEADAVAA